MHCLIECRQGDTFNSLLDSLVLHTHTPGQDISCHGQRMVVKLLFHSELVHLFIWTQSDNLNIGKQAGKHHVLELCVWSACYHVAKYSQGTQFCDQKQTHKKFFLQNFIAHKHEVTTVDYSYCDSLAN